VARFFVLEVELDAAERTVVSDGRGKVSCDGAMARPTVFLGVVVGKKENGR
jgi:hypothetical protein